MAERLADIVAQIENVRQLGAVVTAMRGIAASRAQQARALLAGVEAYSDVMSRAIGEALVLLPSDWHAARKHGQGERGLILFCAEQGFVGALSERVLDTAAGLVEDATVLILGTRGGAIARERGIEPSWSSAMATRSDAAPDVAGRVVDALYARIDGGSLSRVDVVFPRIAAAGGVEIVRHSLLPLDLERFAPTNGSQPPLVTLAPGVLLERLAAEYVYAQLCEAAVHAFAAENEARMLVMSSARTNVETKLDALIGHERRLRQDEITTEILELAAGAEALHGDRRGGRI